MTTEQAQTILENAIESNPEGLNYEQLYDLNILEAYCHLNGGGMRNYYEQRILALAPKKGKTEFRKALSTAVRESRRSGRMSYMTRFEGVLNLKCGMFNADMNGVTLTNDYGEVTKVSGFPITITRRYRDAETQKSYVEIAYRESRGDGNWNLHVYEQALIANSRSILALADMHIDATSGNANSLVEYLRTLLIENDDAIPTFNSCARCGWVTVGEHTVFMPFTDQLHYTGESAFSDVYEALRPSGDYEKWKSTILPIYEQNNIWVRAMLAASAAAPILGRNKDLCFIVHLYGGTGTHKSVALMTAASVWGNPAIGAGYVNSFNSTKVGNERMAHFLNNIPVPLDELGVVRGGKQTVDETIYLLTESTGAMRGKASGGLQDQSNWHTVFMTTGEHGLSLDSNAAGARNRVLHVEVGDAKIFGTEKNAQDISRIVKKHYGHAGRALIRYVIGHENEIDEMLRECQNEIAGKAHATGKQMLSAAYMLLGDKLNQIVNYGRIINDDYNWLIRTLSSEEDVSNYRRNRNDVIGWMAANWKLHFVTSDLSGENTIEPYQDVWGREIIKDGERMIAFIPRALRRYVSEELNQSYSEFVEDARRAGDLYSARHTVRFGKQTVKCVTLKYAEGENESNEDDGAFHASYRET